MEFFAPGAELRQEEVLTVSEVTRNIKIILETALPVLWVEGEISNFKHHTSGHIYFSLKDENAQINCVFWSGRNMNLHFRPQDGMKVLLKGRVTVFERRGQYQLDVLEMQPAGIGALQLAFEQLKKRLAEEGLFDNLHKKPLPDFPERIGIVTSPTGAAIRDLTSVIHRRWPAAHLILRPALVQGPGAAEDITEAIEDFNEFGEIDVLIIGRGGGSLEDLWAFNEENVARAIFQSKIPIISAVGHEIDFTIADFVADLRAPTPSAAAEFVVPDAREVFQQVNHQLSRAYRLVQAQILHGRERLKGIQSSYGLRRPIDLIQQQSQTLDDLKRRLEGAIHQLLDQHRLRVEAIRKHLKALSYQNILERGFTLVRDSATQKVLQSIGDLQVGQEVQIRFHDGSADAHIADVGLKENESPDEWVPDKK